MHYYCNSLVSATLSGSGEPLVASVTEELLFLAVQVVRRSKMNIVKVYLFFDTNYLGFDLFRCYIVKNEMKSSLVTKTFPPKKVNPRFEYCLQDLNRNFW